MFNSGGVYSEAALRKTLRRCCEAVVRGYHDWKEIRIPLFSLLPEHPPDLERERLAAALAPQKVKKFLTTAASVFDYAISHEYIERNPVDAVERCRCVISAPSVAALSELPPDTDDGAVDPTTVLSAAQARHVSRRRHRACTRRFC